jgi:parallel beta-helix repeat protein
MLSNLIKYKFVFILVALVASFYFYFKSYSIVIPFDYSCDNRNYLNFDNFARIQAVRMLVSDTSENFCEIKKVSLLEDSRESKTYDYNLYKELDDLKEMMSNPKLVALRNSYLKLLVKNKESFLSFFISKQNSILKRNIKYLDDYLSYNKVYTELEQLEKGLYELRITADSNSPIFLQDLGSIFNSKENITVIQDNVSSQISRSQLNKYFSKIPFSVGFDSELEITKKTHSFFIKGDGLSIDSIQPKYQNSITESNVELKNNKFILVSLPKKFSFNYVDYNVKEFVSDYPEISFEILSDSLLKIKRGNYNLNRTIVIPYGVSLEIEGGAKLSLNKGVSLIVNGGLNINGSIENPVEINAFDSFGVIAAVGNKSTEVDINFLILSGGNEDSVNGAYFSGALSLYSHDIVKMTNSIVSNNFGEDGLNIKSSKVLLKNNTFLSNYSDQVDLDNTIGHVSGNNFSVQNENSSNGDGLDLSGSKISIQGNNFSYFKDKGISVGEESEAVIFENTFSDNENGMAIKDSSIVHLKGNTFNNNIADINMYVKKNIFNEPVLYLANKNNFNGVIKSNTRKNIFYNQNFNPWDIIEEIYESNPKQLYFLKEELKLDD